jgi:ADP-heptose:LPS heptosyltransferase
MKILIIHPGSLGDVVLSLPALHVLRTSYPGAYLEMIGRPSILKLLGGRFYADRISSIDRADISSLFSGQSDRSDRLCKLWGDYSLAINWLGDKDGDLHDQLRYLGIGNVISSRPISGAASNKHRSEIFLDTLTPLGIVRSPCEPRLYPTANDISMGREALRHQGVNVPEDSMRGCKPILAIHPGSGGRSKCWDLSRYLEVCHQAIQSLECQPIFIVGPADQDLAIMLRLGFDQEVPVLDCLPLPALAGALSWCNIYLGNDSGVSHLAAALGISTMAIFGPTDPALWRPVGRSVSIFSKRTECDGCQTALFKHAQRAQSLPDPTLPAGLPFQGGVSERIRIERFFSSRGGVLQSTLGRMRDGDRPKHRCLDLISPEEVMRTLARTLEDFPSARSIIPASIHGGVSLTSIQFNQ